MKQLQLIDRVVVEIRGEEGMTEQLSLFHIANELRKVAEQIKNGMKGDEWVEEDIRTHEHREVLFEHECIEFGFRMGDKSLICQHYYGSEPKPRVLEDGKFPVSLLTREDIENAGYDGERISDDDMETIASRMDKYYSEGYCDSFMGDLKSALDFLDMPKRKGAK